MEEKTELVLEASKNVAATDTMHNYLIQWNKDFLNECDGFDRCDMGDINDLWELRMAGADVKVLEDERGFPCIPHVFWNTTLIDFFLRQGCDVNAQDKDGSTALHQAVRFLDWYYYYYDVIRFLLEKGADPNIRDNQDRIPISFLAAVPYHRRYGGIQNAKYLFEMLLTHGTNPQSKVNAYGDTILHLAVKVLHREALEKFLDISFKGNIDERSGKSEFEKTPLMVAAELAKYDNFQLLAERGADINATDANGYTSFHHAAWHICHSSSERICDFLMKNNANPNVRTHSGRDVYELLACLCCDDRRFKEVLVAEPSKLVHFYEMKGAVTIIGKKHYNGSYTTGRHYWEMAFDMCQEYRDRMIWSRRFGLGQENEPQENELKASLELVLNYDLASEYEHNRSDDKLKRDLYRAAIRTVDRISVGLSKLWNVLVAGNYPSSASKLSEEELIDILSFVTDKMASFDIEDLVSIDDCDFKSLTELISQCYDLPLTNVSLIVNLAKLAIACWSKLIQITGSKKIKHLKESSFQMFSISTRIQASNVTTNKDPRSSIIKWISEEISGLQKKIVELDLVDEYGNGLLHFACKNWDRELVKTIIDLGANVKSVNDANKNPIQEISSVIFEDKQNLRFILDELIHKGCPFNVRNKDGKLIAELAWKKN